ncbi:MAG: glycosyltransferase family 9 protein [Candidatus Thiodiazotropha sp.]
MSRLPARLLTFTRVASQALRHRRRHPVASPKRILIAHHLLLGDTLMLTPLLAKLRRQYPAAEIAMTMQRAVAPLYSGRPYGVQALPFHPADRSTLRRLFASGPYDLALIPGDNRYSWLAYAMRAHWIVAFDGDRPGYKSWPVDALQPYPSKPTPWPDANCELIPGPMPPAMSGNDWPAPDCEPLPPLPRDYVVFHLGASSPLKLWPAERWRALAEHAAGKGYSVIWSGGPGEQRLVDEVDPEKQFDSLAGLLDLAQLWHLLKGARALVCPDTGVAHLGRIAAIPTLSLYGPGSAQLYGQSRFWRREIFHALSEPIDCRDQPLLYKRRIAWVRRCSRGPAQCEHQAECMRLITLDSVRRHFDQLTNISGWKTGA